MYRQCVLFTSLLTLMISTPGITQPNQPKSMNIFGYADVVLGKNRYNSGTIGFDAYHWTTNLNFKISPSFRFFGDVTYEHGTHHVSSNTGDLKVRYQIEGAYSDWLKIKVGKFLTPFGLQNVNHDASPTYLSVTSPRSLYWKRIIGYHPVSGKIVEDRTFAKEATGLWILGSLCTDFMVFDYNIYITNGRGESGNQHKVDDNDNKGIGGQFSVNIASKLLTGISLYSEKNGITDSDISVAAFSLRYELVNLELITEFSYANLKRDDFRSEDLIRLYENQINSYFIQFAYNLYTKYSLFYRFDHFSDHKQWNAEEQINTFGLNFMINPKVYLKAEYGFYNDSGDVWQTQLSVAF